MKNRKLCSKVAYKGGARALFWGSGLQGLGMRKSVTLGRPQTRGARCMKKVSAVYILVQTILHLCLRATWVLHGTVVANLLSSQVSSFAEQNTGQREMQKDMGRRTGRPTQVQHNGRQEWHAELKLTRLWCKTRPNPEPHTPEPESPYGVNFKRHQHPKCIPHGPSLPPATAIAPAQAIR